MGADGTAPFKACPYCLTEIVESVSSSEEEGPEQQSKASRRQKGGLSLIAGEPMQPDSKPKTCARYLGYLGERSTKEAIPEDCIICEKVVQCMIKPIARSQSSMVSA